MDPAGSAYVTGFIGSTDFPTTAACVAMVDMWWARIGGQMSTLLRTGRGLEMHEKFGDATEWRTYEAAMLENPRRRLLWLHRCHSCGHIDARNRMGMAFVCLACGHTGHAHVNAAGNMLQAGLAVRQRELPVKKLAASAVREDTRGIP